MSTASPDAGACALVILSCDAYRDLWAPCLALHRRYWPDCPYPTFLVSEARAVEDDRVRPLCAGPGLAWSDVVRWALERLAHEHVLLMLDDFFLTRPVRTDVVEARRAELAARRGAYLRLVPWPRPTAPVSGSASLGEHEAGAPFRASLQAAFWRRDVLLELLARGESAWEFEQRGSARSTAIAAPFYSTRAPVLHYVGVLLRGTWSPEGLRLCRKEGLAIDRSARRALSPRERVARGRIYLRLVARGPLSWRLRRALRRLAGRGRRP
jgi:hypothetical protein